MFVYRCVQTCVGEYVCIWMMSVCRMWCVQMRVCMHTHTSPITQIRIHTYIHMHTYIVYIQNVFACNAAPGLGYIYICMHTYTNAQTNTYAESIQVYYCEISCSYLSCGKTDRQSQLEVVKVMLLWSCVQIGLDELIAKDEDEYVRIAVNLACST
jgi:hypothetical protein